jgi:hypothetical protein
MGKVFGAGLVALPIALASSQAFAFPSSRLVYAREGVESCPAEDAARRAVVARLGYDPFSSVAEQTIVAEISRDRDELRGRVELVDERGWVQGTREFRTPTSQCEELVATMALAISIAIDPASESARESRKTAPPGDASSSLTASEAPPPRHAAPSPVSPATPVDEGATPQPATDEFINSLEPAFSALPPRLQFRLGLSLNGSFGTAPDAALGMTASFGVRSRNLSFAIEARGDWEASNNIAGGGAVVASLLAGSAISCFHVRFWFVCGVAVVGEIQDSSDGLPTKRSDEALYVAAGARGGAELPLWGPLFLRPQVDILANFARVELRVDDARAWQAAPISAVIGAGVVTSFP